MTSTASALWEVREISKAFPGVQALDRVSLALNAGEIHALVGQNGSGKSTLVKCLAGVHQPDGGDIRRLGVVVAMTTPTVARTQGVATIYQEFSLVPTLSVAENIFLGRLPTRARGSVVNWQRMRRESVRTLRELGIEIDPDVIVRRLSVAEQQLIEIAKAISEESTLLVMDEPTAALGLSEARRLQGLIRRLAEQGKAILYISHRIDEVFQVVDRISVLKDGRLAGGGLTPELNEDSVVRMMLGAELKEHYPKQHNATAQPALEVEAGLRTSASRFTPARCSGWAGWLDRVERRSRGPCSAWTRPPPAPSASMARHCILPRRAMRSRPEWRWFLRTARRTGCFSISRGRRTSPSRA